RSRWRPGSVDVIAELVRLQHGDPAAAGADDPGALQLREEAADRLTRGAGELGEVGLVHLDRHLFLGLPVAAPIVLGLAAELGEDAGDATGDGLEGLAGEADVGGAEAADEAGDQLQRDLGVTGEQGTD